MRIELELLNTKYARLFYDRTSGTGTMQAYIKGTTLAAARKHILKQFQLITSGNMAGDITSLETEVEQLDHVSYNVDWTGAAPAGLLYVQISDDKVTWRNLNFGLPLTVSGNTSGNDTFVYPAVNVAITPTTITPKYFIDTTPLLSVAATNIPASSALPLELVAVSAATASRIEIAEDIGDYMALYLGAVGAEVLLTTLPLGGGFRDVTIPLSSRVSIRALKNTAISSATFLSINFLG